MQELNELKNLVIQSLEANGSLSNIRAQIRASVFKVVDQQSPAETAAIAGPASKRPAPKASPFAWENCKGQKVQQEQNGLLALQLIKEFLQFYQMDYSNSVFSSESNLREEVKRDKIAQDVPVRSQDQSKPLLLLLLDQAKSSGSVVAAAPVPVIAATAETVPQVPKEEVSAEKSYRDEEREDEEAESARSKATLKEAQELIQKTQNELKTGEVGSLNVSNEGVVGKQKINNFVSQEAYEQRQPINKYGHGDEYSEEDNNSSQEKNNRFGGGEEEEEYGEEGVEEDLNQYAEEDLTESQFKQQHANQFEESEDFIGQSSKGQDISVDSYQLEEFDYVTDVEDQ